MIRIIKFNKISYSSNNNKNKYKYSNKINNNNFHKCNKNLKRKLEIIHLISHKNLIKALMMNITELKKFIIIL